MLQIPTCRCFCLLKLVNRLHFISHHVLASRSRLEISLIRTFHTVNTNKSKLHYQCTRGYHSRIVLFVIIASVYSVFRLILFLTQFWETLEGMPCGLWYYQYWEFESKFSLYTCNSILLLCEMLFYTVHRTLIYTGILFRRAQVSVSLCCRW